MKKLLVVALLGLLFVSLAAFAPLSAKGGPVASNEESVTVYEGTLYACITGHEAYVYELIAGQHLDAGRVMISTDGEYFTITIEAYAMIDDVHVYVYGENDTLPTRRPTPGLAPYSLEDVQDTTATLLIPVGEGTSYTFAIHVAFAEVLEDETDPTGLAGETAYAADEDAEFSGKGAWFYLVAFHIVPCNGNGEEAPVIYIAAHAALSNGETAWALGEYSFIDEGISTRWGWFLSVDTYGTHSFDIYYGAGQNNLESGTLIGTLLVEYTVDTVTITYELTEPMLEEVHVYVGYDYPTTASPGQFPYKLEDLNGAYTAVIVVPVEDIQ